MCNCDLPVRMPTFSPLLKLRSLISMTCKQYTAHAHGIGAIVGDHMQAPELASAAPLSSGESYGAALQTKVRNCSDGRVERARCQ